MVVYVVCVSGIFCVFNFSPCLSLPFPLLTLSSNGETAYTYN